MKLIVVLGVEDNESSIHQFFVESNVKIFSKTPIQGMYINDNANIQQNWFASNKQTIFSVCFFAFVSNEQANQILVLTEEHNKKNVDLSLIHAYQLAVEKVA
ncbi:MAG: hypothetical protein OHK0038_13610 [Flammeovirgaceae bacterium]